MYSTICSSLEDEINENYFPNKSVVSYVEDAKQLKVY